MCFEEHGSFSVSWPLNVYKFQLHVHGYKNSFPVSQNITETRNHNWAKAKLYLFSLINNGKLSIASLSLGQKTLKMKWFTTRAEQFLNRINNRIGSIKVNSKSWKQHLEASLCALCTPVLVIPVLWASGQTQSLTSYMQVLLCLPVPGTALLNQRCSSFLQPSSCSSVFLWQNQHPFTFHSCCSVTAGVRLKQ